MQMTKFLTKNEGINFLTKIKETMMKVTITKVSTKLKAGRNPYMWESSKKSMR